MKKILAIIIILFMCVLTNCTIINSDPISSDLPTEKIEIKEKDSLKLAAIQYVNEFTDISTIDWADLLEMIDDDENPFILSVQSSESYTKSHIKGAYNAAWGEKLAEKITMLPTDEKIYIYCDNGQNSPQAAALLTLLEIEVVLINSGYEDNLLNVKGYENYRSSKETQLSDSNDNFDKEILEFVQDYLNDVSTSGNHLLPAEQVDAISQWDTVNIIDIREADYFDKAHINSSINIPLAEDFLDNLSEYKEKKLILADNDGQSAGLIIVPLRALGYDVFTIKNGMNSGWTPYIVSHESAEFLDKFDTSLLIKWADLASSIDKGETPYILCIDSKDNYEKEHIKGAFLATWGIDLSEKISMLPDDKKVYIYCNDGNVSYQAAALINMLGIDSLAIKGGYKSISSAKDYGKYMESDTNKIMDAGTEFSPFLLNSIQQYVIDAEKNENYTVDIQNVESKIEKEQFIVVDTRSEIDFNQGHIQGAVNITFSRNMWQYFDKLENKKLIIADYGGRLSSQIAAVLNILGYDAYAMNLGMNEWIKTKMPLSDE